MSELSERATLETGEGAGNAGCPMHPRPRVQQKAHALATTGSPATTGIPCAMVLRLIRDLPGDRAFLPPSVVGLIETRNLSASVGAPGPRDFAVRDPVT